MLYRQVTMNTAIATKLTKNPDGVGISACANIMKLWGFNQAEMAITLGTPKPTLQRYLASPEKTKLNRDALDRVSYVLNIHAGLRMFFSNPENIYGYINMKNSNPLFNSNPPKSMILEGSMENLIAVTKHIYALRGQW